ncbi:hypothetical protein EVAR_82785_1 [Eumeta japonica]|uniref:Uncharacterized protein n=1 Tax=Eumeta variegata TaxID=151549 RepID=A0A4C1UP62_EUMVA|nr:hypothetical protein EVAR_82785_1 [Eumeta japonica]
MPEWKGRVPLLAHHCIQSPPFELRSRQSRVQSINLYRSEGYCILKALEDLTKALGRQRDKTRAESTPWPYKTLDQQGEGRMRQ